MKKLIYLAIALIAALLSTQQPTAESTAVAQQTGNSAVHRAYKSRQSDPQIKGEGIVRKVLSDDLKGSKHQRFILSTPEGLSLLVAHNIDLAPRIPQLKKGDQVQFWGEYEWNKKGGIIHWTHHDPSGRHIGGWLKHKGTVYQ